MEVASIEGWHRTPFLVLEFYNQRRKELKEVFPNAGHHYLKYLEVDFEVVVVTQNVDDLHEKAGNKNIIHLHGELLKARSENNEELIYDWHEDINLGDLADDGSQLRPHIVWFGEMVPLLENAAKEVESADILLIIGTSLQVYTEAYLLSHLLVDRPIYLIDPNEMNLGFSLPNLIHIQKKATEGVKELDEILNQFRQ